MRWFLLSLVWGMVVVAARLTAADSVNEAIANTDAKKTPVANVGNGQVWLDAVLELWHPSWGEIIAKGQAGKIAAAEVDRQLQVEWQKNLETVIRDELFYQEAMNDYDRAFQKNVDALYAQMRTTSGGTRQDAEKRLKMLMDKSQGEMIARWINKNVKAAGGIDNLARVLRSRELTYDEWKSRLVRRAYTYSYLSNLFEPFGNAVQLRPKDVKEYYNSHPDKFMEPGAVVFQQLFLDNAKHNGEEATYRLAEDIYNDIMDKKISLTDAVKKYSDDTESVARGGMETTISPNPEREAWLNEVRAAVVDQTPNELGPVLVSPRGCHLVILIRVEPSRKTPFRADIQRIIEDKMEQDKWEQRSEKLYQQLKSRALVQVLMPNFPDRYRWENVRSASKTRYIGMR